MACTECTLDLGGDSYIIRFALALLLQIQISDSVRGPSRTWAVSCFQYKAVLLAMSQDSQSSMATLRAGLGLVARQMEGSKESMPPEEILALLRKHGIKAGTVNTVKAMLRPAAAAAAVKSEIDMDQYDDSQLQRMLVEAETQPAVEAATPEKAPYSESASPIKQDEPLGSMNELLAEKDQLLAVLAELLAPVQVNESVMPETLPESALEVEPPVDDLDNQLQEMLDGNPVFEEAQRQREEAELQREALEKEKEKKVQQELEEAQLQKQQMEELQVKEMVQQQQQELVKKWQKEAKLQEEELEKANKLQQQEVEAKLQEEEVEKAKKLQQQEVEAKLHEEVLEKAKKLVQQQEVLDKAKLHEEELEKARKWVQQQEELKKAKLHEEELEKAKQLVQQRAVLEEKAKQLQEQQRDLEEQKKALHEVATLAVAAKEMQNQQELDRATQSEELARVQQRNQEFQLLQEQNKQLELQGAQQLGKMVQNVQYSSTSHKSEYIAFTQKCQATCRASSELAKMYNDKSKRPDLFQQFMKVRDP